MIKLRSIWIITKMNFQNWKNNPRIIFAFILAFVFCVMLSGRALVFARDYETTMQIFEPFIWAFGDKRSIILSSLLLLFFFIDIPFIYEITPYYLIRIDRMIWVSAQILYIVLVSIIYMCFLLGVFCILCSPLSFPGNLWSKTSALLGYSGIGNQIALPISVKIMEMSNPYACTMNIFLLMTLYTLLTATVIMFFQLLKNKYGGVLGAFLLNIYGLLLDSNIVGRVFRIPETVQYKSNVICGWVSPLNHVTYYMHNFGYDYLPRLWHSYVLLICLIFINVILIVIVSKRYHFNFS